MWIHANKHDAYLELSQLFFFQLVVPEYSIHGLFCLMFMCAGEWVTLGLNIPCCSITSGGTNCSSLTSTYIWNIKMGHGNNSPSLFLPQVFPPSCRRVWGYVWSSECDECRHSELLPKRVLVQARLLPSLLFLLSVQVNPPQSYIIYQFGYPMLCYLMLGCYWWHYYYLLHHLRGTKDFSNWTKEM